MIIGIIGAMEEEVAVLKEEMNVQEVVKAASMDFYKGVLCGRDVVVVRSGVGKVNAALCAQLLVDRFGVEILINTGIAGSLDAQIDIGDIVISTDSLHHDMDATIFGDPLGQVPRMDAAGIPGRSAACWSWRCRPIKRPTRTSIRLREGWSAVISLSHLQR